MLIGMWRKTTVLSLLIALILFNGAVQPAFAQQQVSGSETDTDSGENDEDKYPERMSGRETWEYILYIPGYIIFFPLEMVFAGGEWVAGKISTPSTTPWFIDILATDDGKRALVPTYTERIGGGFKLYQIGWFGEESKAQVKATIGFNYRQQYQVYLKRLSIVEDMLYLRVESAYQLFADEPFYGVGPNTPREAESNYAHERIYARIELTGQISPKFDIMAEARFERNNILPGKDKDDPSTTGMYSLAQLPGLETGIELIGADAKFVYDSRNHRGQPTKGWQAMVGGRIMTEAGDDRYGFWEVTSDIFKYINLFYKRTLVMRLAVDVIEPFDNRAVPFYYLNEIGPKETLRGFPMGRYHDEDMVLGSLEYRWPLTPSKLEALLFCDVGQVAEDIYDDIDKDDLEVALGGGFRLYGDDRELVRVEIAKNDDGWRFQLSVNKEPRWK
ncbi:MAG: BamA/TamA family outer membrane protein [candidate division Zixibacteria bacterium]|nr:BamA/TamA family outer membrane protein [candidate division Zixibacteria bacterium]